MIRHFIRLASPGSLSTLVPTLVPVHGWLAEGAIMLADSFAVGSMRQLVIRHGGPNEPHVHSLWGDPCFGPAEPVCQRIRVLGRSTLGIEAVPPGSWRRGPGARVALRLVDWIELTTMPEGVTIRLEISTCIGSAHHDSLVWLGFEHAEAGPVASVVERIREHLAGPLHEIDTLDDLLPDAVELSIDDALASWRFPSHSIAAEAP